MEPGLQKLRAFYRSCLFQIIVVGLVSLCEPGIWMALNSLGAGGQASTALNNAANALTYGIMSIGCTIAGGIANKITSKWSLVLGAAFYTPYAAGLYCNNRYGNQWFMLLGAGLCGLGASLLWASEGAIAVGYPQQSKRGKYVGIWMAIRQCGPLVGACISLALNAGTGHRGKVSYETYLGLIAISALGAPCALLLSQPEQVIRSDGTRVPHLKGTSIAKETKAIWRQLKSPYLLLLIPVFLAGEFGITYQNNYLTDYFTVRARALASFLTAVLGFLGNMSTGLVLDLPGYSQATKSRAVYLVLTAAITACWAWNAVVQAELSRRSDVPAFDIIGGDFGQGASLFAVYMLFRFLYEALQTYLYWLMGELRGLGDGSQQEAGGIARTTGILRSWESLGSAVAYAVGAAGVSKPRQMVLGFVLWALTVPFTLVAIYGSWLPVGGQVREEDAEVRDPSVSDSGDDTKKQVVRVVVVDECKA